SPSYKGRFKSRDKGRSPALKSQLGAKMPGGPMTRPVHFRDTDIQRLIKSFQRATGASNVLVTWNRADGSVSIRAVPQAAPAPTEQFPPITRGGLLDPLGHIPR